MSSPLERLCNRINDWDLTWVGFGRLRPKPAQDMSGRVVAGLCLVYCPLSAGLAFAISSVVLRSSGRPAPPALPWIIAVAAAGLFLVMQSLLARAWNRRAARLRAGKTE